MLSPLSTLLFKGQDFGKTVLELHPESSSVGFHAELSPFSAQK